MANLELVARTLVDGFVAGLHRSPDFGFSQEFAEYRAYTPGDDLRHVDWNVLARTDKAYLKRFRGETNTQLNILLDCSASMGFRSRTVTKLDYGKYLAAALAYLAHMQRDSTGIIAFDDEVEHFVPPSTRQGQLMRLLHAIDSAALGTRTEFSRPFEYLQQFLKRRGIVILISDFLAPVEAVIAAVSPLRMRGNEVVLFHVLDPLEIKPDFDEPVLLVDMETDDAMEVSPDYARSEYGPKMQKHIESLKEQSRSSGLEYFPLLTDVPLDGAMREYFTLRQRRL
jgi:uncharacterized protein (DUF58 family)